MATDQSIPQNEDWKLVQRGSYAFGVLDASGRVVVALPNSTTIREGKRIAAAPAMERALMALREYQQNGTAIQPGALLWEDVEAALKAAGALPEDA